MPACTYIFKGLKAPNWIDHFIKSFKIFASAINNLRKLYQYEGNP